MDQLDADQTTMKLGIGVTRPPPIGSLIGFQSRVILGAKTIESTRPAQHSTEMLQKRNPLTS